MRELPVGYRSLHPDPSFNFELNRWLSVLPEAELADLAKRIDTHEQWTCEMLRAAERAEQSGSALRTAFYLRAAEFFMPPTHPEKRRIYERFLAAFDGSPEGRALERHEIPFDGGRLPAAIRPAVGDERSVVLLHGGFDSFMEELFEWAEFLAERGRRVVLFEGPGQGGALRRHGLAMRPEWERPVAAVLDHFGIDRATILGISLGGYLAPRAAAFELRIDRLIVCDVLDDFFDCFAGRSPGVAAGLRALERVGLRAPVNALLGRVMQRDPGIAWAMRHGMHVSGSDDPFAFVRWLRRMRTAPFSRRITQDVLLLAGASDHIVPLRQFHRQMRALPNARSLTTRLFTGREHAANHCQIGNVGLALDVIATWLELQDRADARLDAA